MDLEEWEFLPDHGFLDFNEDPEKKIISGKYSSNLKSVFDMNYFNCPSPNSHKVIEPSPGSNSRKVTNQQLVPVAIQLERRIGKAPDDEQTKEIIKRPVDVSFVPSAITEKMISNKGPNMGPNIGADPDLVSQVFFIRKMKENEFVDMKMDSPKSPTSRNNIIPQVDAAGTFNFEDKGDNNKALESKNCCSPRKKKLVDKADQIKSNMDCDANTPEESTWEENSGGLNLWKWSLTGIGAICSFGVAAATICVIIFGSQQKTKQQQQNQKFRFQIYTDDKRINQVVQQATISAVRGVPISRAHITLGGYYDAL